MKNEKNKHRYAEDDFEEYNPKKEYRDEYSKKKQTQKQAKDRRQGVREHKEERDYWN